jgi:hypothetical protein
MLNLELVLVDGYDFFHPCDGPRNSHLLFFKRPLVDVEFHMPVLDELISLVHVRWA